MDWLIILSLAFAVLALGMVVVALIVLLRAVKELSAAGKEAQGRMAPLTEELRSEQAVTQLELEALQRRRQEARPPARRGVRYP